MTFEENWEYIQKLKDIDIFLEQDIQRIQSLSHDEDDLIRSYLAANLVYFDDEKSKDILCYLMNDIDPMFRTEAYDSLAMFISADVCNLLKNAIFNEDDELACSYAISSWADIITQMYECYADDRCFINEVLSLPKVYTSERLQIECFRALYLFGEETALEKLLAKFDSKDYQIRATIAHIADELLTNKNERYIRNVLTRQFQVEESVAVKKVIEKCLERE